MNIIIITGASSGIGREFAYQIDQYFNKVDEVWLIARRQDRLQDVARIMRTKTRILPLDLTNLYDLNELKELLTTEHAKIQMLINCAGYGMVGNFSKLSLKEQTGMISLNCKALTEITYMCIPYMCKNGRVIQLASSAAFLPQMNFAVYAATKSYVLSFSRALREELKNQNIFVTAVCPGPVDTEFFELAEKYEEKYAFKKYIYEDVEVVVQNALIASYYKRSLSVTGVAIKGFNVLAKVVPHEALLQGMNLGLSLLNKSKTKE